MSRYSIIACSASMASPHSWPPRGGRGQALLRVGQRRARRTAARCACRPSTSTSSTLRPPVGERERQRGGDGRLAGAALAGDDVQPRRGRDAGDQLGAGAGRGVDVAARHRASVGDRRRRRRWVRVCRGSTASAIPSQPWPPPLPRLAELGITLPPVVAPLAAYVPAVRSGSLVFTSGQLPMVDGALAATGKVGAEVSAERGAGAAPGSCALNALAAVDALVGLDAVVRVVKVVGFVASCPGLHRPAGGDQRRQRAARRGVRRGRRARPLGRRRRRRCRWTRRSRSS